ncbi:MAG: hypothetical protein HC834_03245 [Rhodospirillales bacterium]|nr:hypothetical protein [Rhodospirillales bacterium]
MPSSASTIPDGDLVWTRMIGTSAYFEQAQGVAADTTGNIYICGGTDQVLGRGYVGPAKKEDAWFAKYDPDGVLIWVRQFGSAGNDNCDAVAVDNEDNILLVGTTSGRLTGPVAPKQSPNIWFAKYTAEGKRAWARQISAFVGSTPDIATDADGNVLVSGNRYRSSISGLVGGGYDAFVAKYSPAGKRMWIREVFGIGGTDFSYGVAADPSGNVLLTGMVEVLPRPADGTRLSDGFVAKYSPVGSQLWRHRLSTEGGENGTAVAADQLGDIYVTGNTTGAFTVFYGWADPFLAKLPAD